MKDNFEQMNESATEPLNEDIDQSDIVQTNRDLNAKEINELEVCDNRMDHRVYDVVRANQLYTDVQPTIFSDEQEDRTALKRNLRDISNPNNPKAIFAESAFRRLGGFEKDSKEPSEVELSKASTTEPEE